MRRLPTAIFEAKVLFKFRGLYYYDNPSLKREKEGFIERIALELGKTAEELKRNALITITKKRIPKMQTKGGEDNQKTRMGDAE